jgi:hypothetical protein
MVTTSEDYFKHVYFTCQIQIVNVRTFSTGISLSDRQEQGKTELVHMCSKCLNCIKIVPYISVESRVDTFIDIRVSKYIRSAVLPPHSKLQSNSTYSDAGYLGAGYPDRMAFRVNLSRILGNKIALKLPVNGSSVVRCYGL